MTEDREFQVRVSVLSVPKHLSPLKFKSFLHKEAKDIQNRTPENGLALIRLYLPETLVLQITQKKLDAMLHDVVNKYSNIEGIELISVKAALNPHEMLLEAEEVQMALEELKERDD